MAIPKYHEMTLPLLRMIAERSQEAPVLTREAYAFVADYFSLSDEDRSVRAKSGTLTFHDNASWAMTYMRQAGLILSPKRGQQCITARGIEVLNSGVSSLGKDYLIRYPEFEDFLNRKKIKKVSVGLPVPPSLDSLGKGESELSPEQAIEAACDEINEALASELLEVIMQQPPSFFEKMVIDLLLAMGYGDSTADSGFVTKQSGDEGIDGVIREDKLGFSGIYIQAKRWQPDTSICRPEIQKFAGALMGSGATKGLFISTAKFSSGAIDFADKQLQTKIILIDGEKLVQLMIAYGVGVTVRYRYELKSIDKDYFDYGGFWG